MAPEYLFVYGTLRRGAQTGNRLLPSHLIEFVGSGLYQGKLFELGGYPGAVPSDASDDQIKGEVYLLREEPLAILDRLDEYEGCSPRQPEPYEYKRVQTEILLEGGSVMAWVYLFNRSTAKRKRIVSGDYLEFIQAMRQ